MMIPAAIAGGVIGTGVLVGARAMLAPRPQRLDRRLTELYEAPASEGFDAVRARWQRWGLSSMRFGGGDLGSLRRDLEICQIGLERHAMMKLAFAMMGAASPLAMSVVWSAAGIDVVPVLILLACAAFAVIGFVIPDFTLAKQATARRREFRYGLSLYLELVVIVLAGGGGVATAMHDAASAGQGWSFDEIRRALHNSRMQRTSPWAALRDLAERIGSPELEGLASSVELAGTSGARVRDSLRAKAASVREHELTETEAEALAASERMGGPMVGMFGGLVLLIGYPAIVTILRL